MLTRFDALMQNIFLIFHLKLKVKTKQGPICSSYVIFYYFLFRSHLGGRLKLGAPVKGFLVVQLPGSPSEWMHHQGLKQFQGNHQRNGLEGSWLLVALFVCLEVSHHLALRLPWHVY